MNWLLSPIPSSKTTTPTLRSEEERTGYRIGSKNLRRRGDDTIPRVLFNDNNHVEVAKSSIQPSSISPTGSNTVVAVAAVERYDFRQCPFQNEWIFPSSISGLADLVSTTSNNNSSNNNPSSPWYCGRERGLKLHPLAQAYLRAPVLDQFWNDHFNNNGAGNSSTALVVSLWFLPDNKWMDDTVSDRILPILTWTTPSSSEQGSNFVTSVGCPGYELQIALYLDHFVIRYSDQDEAQSCKILYLRQVNVSKLSTAQSNHLLLQLAPGSTSVYLNGDSLHQDLHNSFPSTPTAKWKTTQLNVFGVDDSPNNFRGAIHEISLYNRAFTAEQTYRLYQDGLQQEPQDLSTAHNRPVGILDFGIANPDPVVIPQAYGSPVSIDLLVPPEVSTVLTLAVEFTKLPLHGNISSKLSNNDGDGTIKVRSHVGLTGNNSSTTVRYLLSNFAYFNTPTINALGEPIDTDSKFTEVETFAYRIIIVDDDDFVVASTSEGKDVIQTITVRHVNHRPILHAQPTTVLSSNDGVAPEIVCKGIILDDAQDHDLDLVRVDVTTKQGRLSLNPQYRSAADFVSCRGRTQSAWQCLGDGVADRHMTFLAVPSNVQYILQDMRYEGFSPGAADEIFVAIYDGANEEDCLSTDEHAELSRMVDSKAWSPLTTTIFDGCYRVNTTISVPSMDSLKRTDGGTGGYNDDEASLWGIPNSDVNNFDLADLLFWILLSIFILFVSFYCCRLFSVLMRLFQARGRPVAIDDESSDIHGRTVPSDEESLEQHDDTEVPSSGETSKHFILLLNKAMMTLQYFKRSDGRSS